METVCDKMTDYAVKTDPETEKISYVRFQARGDEPLELEHISITAETGKKLKIAVSFDVVNEAFGKSSPSGQRNCVHSHVNYCLSFCV